MTNTIITIGVSVVFTLIGVIWNSLNNRIKSIEARINELDNSLEKRIKTAVQEAFKDFELNLIKQGRLEP
jgi:uncharacterized membrane protein